MPKNRKARHSLSHYRLLTADMGYLLPVACLEVLPGDSFNHRSQALLRVNPLAKPVMHPIDVRIHHWFVPNRIVWSGWEDFITRKDTETALPTISHTGGVDEHSLIDHLGIPDNDVTFNALPVRAYNAIYNFAYRDQDLITEVSEDDLDLKRIAWEKDRFTSARANPQQGTAITIPFQSGSSAPVRPEDDDGNLDDYMYMRKNSSPPEGLYRGGADGESGTAAGSLTSPTGTYTNSDAYQLFADLSAAAGAGIDVNEFRQAMAQQKFLEHRNRFGSRFEDYLRYLGIRPSDARLQNPEYLGGGKTRSLSVRC